jgi:hypothetical protein
MRYRAGQQFGVPPWAVSLKDLAWWNRLHGRLSRVRSMARARELRLRLYRAEQRRPKGWL